MPYVEENVQKLISAVRRECEMLEENYRVNRMIARVT